MTVKTPGTLRLAWLGTASEGRTAGIVPLKIDSIAKRLVSAWPPRCRTTTESGTCIPRHAPGAHCSSSWYSLCLTSMFSQSDGTCSCVLDSCSDHNAVNALRSALKQTQGKQSI